MPANIETNVVPDNKLKSSTRTEPLKWSVNEDTKSTWTQTEKILLMVATFWMEYALIILSWSLSTLMNFNSLDIVFDIDIKSLPIWNINWEPQRALFCKRDHKMLISISLIIYKSLTFSLGFIYFIERIYSRFVTKSHSIFRKDINL